jgi:hypothetical protein
MGIVDKKRELMSKIAAVKALANTKKDKINSSYSSINNKLNSSKFLIDITSALVGAKKLKDYVVDMISYRLPEIEEAVKEGLKLELKEICSCHVNPSIPSWLKQGGTGIQIKVTDVDFFDTMKVNPTSFAGSLIYTDTASGISSKDFNTYLYYTIQAAGTPNAVTQWGKSITGTDILESEFIPNGTTNNVIKYTTSIAYSNKNLSDFNNDFIDSLSLFGNPGSNSSSKIIASIMEDLFGSISAITGKSKKQLTSQLEFLKVVDNVLETETPKIDDSAFKFDKSTIAKIDKESNDKKKGLKEIKTNVMTKVSVGAGVVKESMTAIEESKTKLEEVNAIKTSLDDAAKSQANSSSNEADKETIKTNFFLEIIKKLQRVVMSSIMTPEFITIFAINHQIIHGQGTSYDGPIDFIKKNRKLVRSIGKLVLSILLKYLLNLVIKELTKLLQEKLVGDKIEKAKNKVSIYLSYLGVPQDVIAQIRKYT